MPGVACEPCATKVGWPDSAPCCHGQLPERDGAMRHPVAAPVRAMNTPRACLLLLSPPAAGAVCYGWACGLPTYPPLSHNPQTPHTHTLPSQVLCFRRPPGLRPWALFSQQPQPHAPCLDPAAVPLPATTSLSASWSEHSSRDMGKNCCCHCCGHQGTCYASLASSGSIWKLCMLVRAGPSCA